MTPTPRERAYKLASQICASQSDSKFLPMVDLIGIAITSAISDQTAALQAALGELAKVKQQAHDNNIQVGHASAALNRVLLHVTGCSAGEFDTYMETAERIIDQLKDDAQHLKETSEAFVQTTNELLAAQKELEAVKKERDAFALALQYRCPVCGGEGVVTGCGPNDEPILYECANCAPANQHLATHDRQVAARVLRDAAKILAAHGHKERVQPHLPNTDARAWAATCYECASEDFSIMAEQYEAGEREVPGE